MTWHAIIDSTSGETVATTNNADDILDRYAEGFSAVRIAAPQELCNYARCKYGAAEHTADFDTRGRNDRDVFGHLPEYYDYDET